MANRRETEVRKQYEDRGWKAVRGGWPDWLFGNKRRGTLTIVEEDKQEDELAAD